MRITIRLPMTSKMILPNPSAAYIRRYIDDGHRQTELCFHNRLDQLKTIIRIMLGAFDHTTLYWPLVNGSYLWILLVLFLFRLFSWCSLYGERCIMSHIYLSP